MVETVKWRKPSNRAASRCGSWTRSFASTRPTRTRSNHVSPKALRWTTCRVFNASLSAGTRSAIDLRDADELDEDAFKEFVVAAVAHNGSRA